MQQKFTGLLMATLLAGCASGGVPAETGARLGDPALYPLLGVVPLDSAAGVALQAYELAHMDDFMERISLVAEDPNAGLGARYNAVRILGERRSSAALPALRIAATDRDPRVRAAVVVAASEIAERTGEGMSLVEAALADPAAEVAAKALERLGPEHLETLRAFAARQQNAELARIAQEMIRVAEERGARLVGDSAGVLRRRVTADVSLEFRPTMRWSQWDAAVGTVTIRQGDGAAVQLDSIEVVRGVVPVFFSPDAQHVVYERGRRIYVRDLQQGAVRQLGAGVAPRVLPFTSDFVFMRERTADRTSAPDATRLQYEVVRASLEGDSRQDAVLGMLPAAARQLQHGGYSPVRWLRVVEYPGGFGLEGQGIEPFHLPPPFAAGTLP